MLTGKINRESMHKFVDWLPECEWEAVHWTLAACLKRHNSFEWKIMTYPEDDEGLTEEEILAIEEGDEDIRAGRTVPHEEVVKWYKELDAYETRMDPASLNRPE